eukprot:SAG31_NODE_9271_length_1306_cov_1.309859_1_plen_321_part_10
MAISRQTLFYVLSGFALVAINFGVHNYNRSGRSMLTASGNSVAVGSCPGESLAACTSLCPTQLGLAFHTCTEICGRRCTGGRMPIPPEAQSQNTMEQTPQPMTPPLPMLPPLTPMLTMPPSPLGSQPPLMSSTTPTLPTMPTMPATPPLPPSVLPAPPAPPPPSAPQKLPSISEPCTGTVVTGRFKGSDCRTAFATVQKEQSRSQAESWCQTIGCQFQSAGLGYQLVLANRDSAAIAAEAAQSCGRNCLFPVSGLALSPPQERYAFEGHNPSSDGGFSQQTHPSRAVAGKATCALVVIASSCPIVHSLSCRKCWWRCTQRL